MSLDSSEQNEPRYKLAENVLVAGASASETPTGDAVLPRELLDGIAAVKGHPPVRDEDIEKAPIAEVYPLSAALIKAEQRQEAQRKKDQEEAIKNQIGLMDGNKGVFMGQCKILGRVFNKYSAAADVTDKSGQKTTFKYSDLVNRVAELNRQEDRNDTSYANDEELAQAIEEDTYDGAWFIPPRSMVARADSDGPGKNDTLYAHKDEKKLAGSFKAAADGGEGSEYWTSTPSENRPDFMDTVRFSDGVVSRSHKNGFPQRGRLMRLELA